MTPLKTLVVTWIKRFSLGKGTLSKFREEVLERVKRATSSLTKSFWRRAIPVLAIVLCLNVIIHSKLFQESFPFVHRAGLALHRILCSTAPRPINAKLVKVVPIGDRLHQRLGDPTNRQFIGSLITNAVKGDPAVIVLDFKLVAPPGYLPGTDAPERSKQNAALLHSIQQASAKGVPVVIASWLRSNDKQQFEIRPGIFRDGDLPLADDKGECPYKDKACVRIGNINVPIDERQIPLVTVTTGGAPYSESLALAAASAYEDAIDRYPKTRNKQIIASAINHDRFVYGSFIPEEAFQNISAEALAKGDEKAIGSCRGRILIIGGRWHSDLEYGPLTDTYGTPVGQMPGVYLEANYIEALLDDRYQPEVSLWTGLGLDMVIAGALYYSFHTARSNRSRLAVIGAFLMPILLGYVGFANFNRYVDFIVPLTLCFLHLGIEVAVDYWGLRQGRIISVSSVSSVSEGSA